MNLSKIIQKLSNIGYRILYAFPFAMKAGDSEILGQKASSMSDSPSINVVVNETNVYGDMLKGEVTQQVEEVRYSNYQVFRESEKHNVIDGIEISDSKKDRTPWNFIQKNLLYKEDLLGSMKKIGGTDDFNSKHLLSITYGDIPKYRVEDFCDYIKVNKIENTVNITLTFNIYKNPSVLRRTFQNELIKIEKNFKKYGKVALERSDAISNVNGISFVTDKCEMEDSMISYIFVKTNPKSIFIDNDVIHVVYTTNDFNRTDLTDKYYSKSMAKKYEEKAVKTKTIKPFDGERVVYCSECGKEMNVYDYDITEATIGVGLCKECLEKKLNENDD